MQAFCKESRMVSVGGRVWLVSAPTLSQTATQLLILVRSIHDVTLAAYATNDIRFPDGTRPPDSRAGSKHSHCWAYVQGLCRVKECPYLHPVAIHLCKSPFAPQITSS